MKEQLAREEEIKNIDTYYGNKAPLAAKVDLQSVVDRLYYGGRLMLDRKKEDIEKFQKEDCPFVPNLDKLKREPNKGIESFLERNEAECRKRELKM